MDSSAAGRLRRITTSVGLVSGFPIQDTVDKLVNLQASTRDSLTTKTKNLNDQKTEVFKLETMLVGLQFTTNRLGSSSLFNQPDYQAGVVEAWLDL